MTNFVLTPSLAQIVRALAALLIIAAATATSAQEHPRRASPQASEQSEPRQGEQARESVLRLLPADSVTEHLVAIPGGDLPYTATAGTFSLYDQSGERSAAVYYTAYVAKNAEAANRPITFAFNGGPGAASAYLNLGVLGPRILEFPGNDPAAARMQDNPATWLAFTDLVLIDPVGAGWSRPAKPDGGKAFYGVRQDAQAMAKVISLYLAKNGRSGSPKYLLGESYGGYRA
ncbi:MAG TPA: carboxypeptidase, partial [Xanthobacteraceae bacterium]|nr:carboxypeptidase [Xanthobacteraceae bacterium]